MIVSPASINFFGKVFFLYQFYILRMAFLSLLKQLNIDCNNSMFLVLVMIEMEIET